MSHAMLRRYFQLTGNMVLNQIGKEFAAGIFHQVIEANTGTDKNLLDAGDLA